LRQLEFWEGALDGDNLVAIRTRAASDGPIASAENPAL
jgi:hypothetical protein